jgi:excisionase family DNA binding protein
MDLRDGVYDPDEVAAFLKLNRQHVLRLARRGLLPSIKLGRFVRFPVADLKQVDFAKDEVTA